MTEFTSTNVSVAATPPPDSPLWLGVDLSTQSLTLVLLADQPGNAHVHYIDSVVYSKDLPQYGTQHGMHVSDGDAGEKVDDVCGRVHDVSPADVWVDGVVYVCAVVKLYCFRIRLHTDSSCHAHCAPSAKAASQGGDACGWDTKYSAVGSDAQSTMR